MIRYLIQTSEALITISILVGLIVAYGQTTLKRKPFRLLVGLILAGLAAGAVMGYLKNATNRIDTSLWNLRIFTVYLIALVAYFIGKIKPLHEWLKDKTDYVDAVLLGLIALMVKFYILPDIYSNLVLSNFTLAVNTPNSGLFFILNLIVTLEPGADVTSFRLKIVFSSAFTIKGINNKINNIIFFFMCPP